MLRSNGGRALRALAALAAALTCAFIAAPAGAATLQVPSTRSFGRLVRLSDEVVPKLSRLHDLGEVSPNKSVQVAVVLRHDLGALHAFQRQQYDRSSSLYHRWLTPAQFQARFGVPAQRLAYARSYATRFGMKLYNPRGLGDVTLVTGTAAQAERTFDVSIHRFRTSKGRVFFANTRGPAVPAKAGVAGVIGLQNLVQLHVQHTATSAPRTQDQCAGSVCTGLLGPQDLWSVYDQPGSDMGQGQSIGVIGEGQTTDVIHALRRFEQTRHLPRVPVQVYWTDPGAKTDDAGRIEWELDTQASTGMAPLVSEVRLYFGSNLQLPTLATTLQSWASDPDGPNQVNASLGICEDDPALDGLLGPSQDASGFALAQAASEGRAFFASAGDTGAGCAIAVAENGITYGLVPTASYPAADPNATAVGGTVVYTNGARHPKRVDEHAWDHTGGTRSDFIAMPAYQKGVTALQGNYCTTKPNGDPYPGPTLCRGTADVSALSGDGTIIVNHKANGAIQANGYDMVDDAMTKKGKDKYNDHFSEGGTSLSSPLWAGMWARVNAAHRGGPTGRANDTIYRIAQGPKGGAAFNDIVEGANPLPATPGWDFPTGWGSPNVTPLILAADGSTRPVHDVRPHGPDPKPIQAPSENYGCPATMVDPQGDAISLPQSAPQLDILHGDLALSADGTKLRAALTVANLGTTVPEGWTSVNFLISWTAPDAGAPPTGYTKNYYAAEAQVDITGAITYTDGTVAYDDSGNSLYTSANTVTGSFKTGRRGTVEIDVPLADTGHPSAGDSLGTVGGETDESNPVTGLIVDTGTSGKQYHLGSPSCLS